MKIVPTWQALWATVFWTIFAASMLVNVIALWGWAICADRLYEILEVAEFNDLDGDGYSNVLIRYK